MKAKTTDLTMEQLFERRLQQYGRMVAENPMIQKAIRKYDLCD